MEIKYAYEMTRKAEEVRKEIQAKNNALACAFIEDHIMPEIERVAGTGETVYECNLASLNEKGVKQASAMNTSGLRKPCGTCNFQARFNYLA